MPIAKVAPIPNPAIILPPMSAPRLCAVNWTAVPTMVTILAQQAGHLRPYLSDMVPTRMDPTACVREAMAVHRDVQIDGRYGPSGPISPK